MGGTEVAHGRFANGIKSISTARSHLIEPNERLVHAFDMRVAGQPFSVSLAGLEFHEASGVTTIAYTAQACFLDTGDYDAESRVQGTNGLLDTFIAYVSHLV